MNTDILGHLGLRDNEIVVYLALLRIGTTHAGRLITETKIAKATIYDTLSTLEQKGLVHAYSHEKTMKYTAEEPAVLEHIVQKEFKRIKKCVEDVSDLIPELYGMQRQYFQVPKIRMYQGLEGMRIVLEDSLSSSEVIRTLVNVQDMERYFKAINDPYAQKRAKMGIRKQALVENTPWCRDFLKNYVASKVSTIRYLPIDFPLSHIEMNIYDHKVTYITYRDREPVGIIIEDADIYMSQKALFDSLWSITQ